ncbi:MAG: hypothetical protein KGH72_02450 [Candidatus Micrarchaeota archaeon]|nr:hypothetical protein [Candidatus Micrarchaeota archaeon]
MGRGRKTVGIDVDGVLADSIRIWLQEAEQRFGIKADKEDIVKYDLPGLFNSIDYKDTIDLFRLAWKGHHRIGLEDPAIPSILDNLRDRFRICITTASDAETSEVRAWLKNNRIFYDELFHLPTPDDKHRLDSIDIYIDDHAEVIENVARSGRVGIMLRQPWNDDAITTMNHPRIVVAYNWREIEQLLLARFD